MSTTQWLNMLQKLSPKRRSESFWKQKGKKPPQNRKTNHQTLRQLHHSQNTQSVETTRVFIVFSHGITTQGKALDLFRDWTGHTETKVKLG